jgi:hypothetical protein
MKNPISRPDRLLRVFWFVLGLGGLVGLVVMFEARNADRDLAISKKGQQILAETIEAQPSATEAMQALMRCIGNNYLKVDKTSDEDDFNRPRQVCPKYGAALEATHPSPMGMRELALAYRQLILGIKASL